MLHSNHVKIERAIAAVIHEDIPIFTVHLLCIYEKFSYANDNETEVEESNIHIAAPEGFIG